MEPSKKKSGLRRRPILIIVLFLFAVAIWTSLSDTRLRVIQTTKERLEQLANRALPIEKVGTKAARRLRLRLDETGLSLGSAAFIRIFKQEAELEVWLKADNQFQLLHTYPICKHSGFLGPKLKEGDKQAPEGFYSVTKKQLNPGSRHYRAFNIGFPNEYDRAHGRTGSALMVHGGCTSIGCYAMTDEGVAEIYETVESALDNGQQRVPVHIFPFRMTAANMSTAPKGRWTPFWQNIKVGYDQFETSQLPPPVSVCDKRYAFDNEVSGCQAIAGW